MEPLLLVTYSVVFAALILYVIYLRSRLTQLEQRIEDLSSGPERDNPP